MCCRRLLTEVSHTNLFSATVQQTLGVAVLTDGSMKKPDIPKWRDYYDLLMLDVPGPMDEAYDYYQYEAGIFVNCLQSVCCMCAEPDLDDTAYILLFLLSLVCESR